MRCEKCGHENASVSWKCEKCGGRITRMVISPSKPSGVGASDAAAHFFGRIRVSGSLRPPDGRSLGGVSVPPPKPDEPVPPPAPYPWHKRSPRPRRDLPAGEITLSAPPSIGETPTINWLSVLAAPVGMIVVMLLITLITSGSGSAMSGSYFLYMVPMSLIGVVVAVLNYRSQRKKHRETATARTQLYTAYLAEQRQNLESIAAEQSKILLERDPALEDCLRFAERGQRIRLWERLPEHEDFMSASVGVGRTPLCNQIVAPPKRFGADEDPLEAQARALATEFQYVFPSPILCDLKNTPSLGIVGERKLIVMAAKALLVRIAALHSYEDVRIILLYPRDEREKWSAFRWLPHVFDDRRERRYLADDALSVNRLLGEFETVINERRRNQAESRGTGTVCKPSLPHLLFVVAEASYLEDGPMATLLTLNDSSLGVSTVFLSRTLSSLPKNCAQIVELSNDGKGCMYGLRSADDKRWFAPERLSDEQLERFARSLAPIRTQSGGKAAGLPENITFLECYGVDDPSELPIAKNWEESRAMESMAVPIGVRANGEMMYFDIHEGKHGPNGLVAGMVRSGKTEMLQSWILSMAVKFPPSEVAFVLIDFKGSGLLQPLYDLPHLAGTISDLDTRVERSLIALQSEVTRRLELLRSAGCTSILAYQRKYRDKLVPEPLPFLIIVIDEFVELKNQFPDFMSGLESIIRRGRSLGMYSILSTQKPGGAVTDQMYANTSFRWCLKVASAQDSKDMLGRADAAYIKNPGRAYIRVGEFIIYEQIQTLWSGALYDPGSKAANTAIRAALVALDGQRSAASTRESVKKSVYTKENDVIVKAICACAKAENVASARCVLPEALPHTIHWESLYVKAFNGRVWPETDGGLRAAVGLADDLQAQAQYPLFANLSGNGHLVVYGAPQTGKTIFLQTLARSLLSCYPPDELNLYAIDHGGRSLGVFSNFPHVGGVVNDYDAEAVASLCRLLEKELKRRRGLFEKCGVSNIRSYRDFTGEKLPYIVVMIDDCGGILGFGQEWTEFFRKLAQDGAGYGLCLAVSAGMEMDTSRISSNIKNRFVLSMVEKSAYRSILGRFTTPPESVPGRGITVLEDALEFQTALPAEGAREDLRVVAIKKLGEQMSAAWNGTVARNVPLMPEIITFGSVSVRHIALGLTFRDTEPLEHDFDIVPALLIAGGRGAGKSTLLRTLGRQLARRGNCEQIVAIGIKDESWTEGYPVLQLRTAQELDDYLASVVPIMNERIARKKDDPDAVLPPVAVLVDDWRACIDMASPKSRERLSQLILFGREMGVYLAATTQVEDCVELYRQGETGLVRMLALRYAVLLGVSLRDADICFQRNVPTEEKQILPGRYEGFYLTPDTAVRFKAMNAR